MYKLVGSTDRYFYYFYRGWPDSNYGVIRRIGVETASRKSWYVTDTEIMTECGVFHNGRRNWPARMPLIVAEDEAKMRVAQWLLTAGESR
jgi:hypothetical protein